MTILGHDIGHLLEERFGGGGVRTRAGDYLGDRRRNNIGEKTMTIVANKVATWTLPPSARSITRSGFPLRDSVFLVSLNLVRDGFLRG